MLSTTPDQQLEPTGRRLRSVGIVVSAVLVTIAAALAIAGGRGTDAEPSLASAPHLAAGSDLIALEETLGHPIYWAGDRSPDALELSTEADGGVYLRYLPPGVEAGDPRPDFLTIGTYPVPAPVAALRRVAAKTGSSIRHLPDGAAIFADPSAPGSVYLAHPRTELQIEVYDPTPGRSSRLIRSGAIRPVGVR